MTLVGGETVSLPYFNFEDMFLSLVHDEKLTQPENMISEHVDKNVDANKMYERLDG